ncbi:ribonuclease R [Erysipelothrix sp. HDW6A]|uniref:ribonuclease R n=1 Tax=Erysipelothrix sp. HDW6A TaxID=2714928 RepID=UPI001409B7EE|nr:ribonuclease R [Erysipelothrix sp. HDW6A]QIK56760.1 ribonuclease R [Erysipelothrix sp. HDW6A]
MSKFENIRSVILGNKVVMSLENWHQQLKEEASITEINQAIDEMVHESEIVLANDTVYPIDNKRYAVGTFRAVRDSFGFVENEAVSIYVGSKDFGNAIDLDTVLVEIISAEKEFGKILHVVKHNREVLLGTLKVKKKKLIFESYDTRIHKDIEYTTKLEVKENDRVIGHIQSIDDKIYVEVTSVLGQADAPGMDVQSVLFVYGIDVDFNDDVKKEIPSIPKEINQEDTKGRIDHRDQYVITIDGEDAKDLDDAIYMESLANGYRLYVHIADVAHYVNAKSAIGQSAYERSSSVYMVDRVVPMLPKELSNGICSLHPHVDRLAMTVQIDINFNGEVIDYHLYESVIQSKRRMSYNEVNTSEDLEEVSTMVHMMLDCASRLKYKREQAGSIGFDSDESNFVIDNNGKVLDIYRRETGEAEEMIEMFMVIANEVVAQMARYQYIPVLYRVHDKPSKEKMQDLSHTLRVLGYRMKGNLEDIHPKELQRALEFFKDKPELPVVSKLMLRSMSKAKYGEEPTGHFGLALDDYTHFTSPIRRYPDLLLHQQLKKYAIHQNRKDLEKDEKFVVEAGKYASQKERSILDAERQVEKLKKAQFMLDKVGETFVGYISGVTNFGIFVELPNTVEGLVHVRTLKDDYYEYNATAQKMVGERTKTTYSIGQKVKVKCVEIDMAEWVIHFELIVPRKSRRKGRKPIYERRRKKS